MKLSIYIGWDPREVAAWNVCRASMRRRATVPVQPEPIILADLRGSGLYGRPTELRDGRLWDVISEAPMSTEFAISRFFVPLLEKRRGGDADWALFCDCDFLWLGDIAELVASVDSAKALMCVQHVHAPTESVKMDGQAQLLYARKNWSSLMLFNLRHPAHAALDLDLLNSAPGRDLHRFCWLEDDMIGALADDWNWLEGSSPVRDAAPRAVHFTRGGPWMPGWENVGYAELWRRELTTVDAAPADGGAPAALSRTVGGAGWRDLIKGDRIGANASISRAPFAAMRAAERRQRPAARL